MPLQALMAASEVEKGRALAAQAAKNVARTQEQQQAMKAFDALG